MLLSIVYLSKSEWICLFSYLFTYLFFLSVYLFNNLFNLDNLFQNFKKCSIHIYIKITIQTGQLKSTIKYYKNIKSNIIKTQRIKKGKTGLQCIIKYIKRNQSENHTFSIGDIIGKLLVSIFNSHLKTDSLF